MVSAMSQARIGSFDDLLNLTEEPLRAIVSALKETILEVHPDACEVVAASATGRRPTAWGRGR